MVAKGIGSGWHLTLTVEVVETVNGVPQSFHPSAITETTYFPAGRFKAFALFQYVLSPCVTIGANVLNTCIDGQVHPVGYAAFVESH